MLLSLRKHDRQISRILALWQVKAYRSIKTDSR